MSAIALFAVLGIASVGSLVAALAIGSYPLELTEVLRTLVTTEPGTAHDIVWHLRAPRAFAAYACGGLLALAGAFLQVLLRNALADPYVLGVSGGASLGALIALTLGVGVALMNAFAFAGALLALAIVFALTWRSRDWNVYRLLLTGVVLSAGLSAAISLVLVLAPEGQVKGMLFWLMGDLSQADTVWPAWVVLAFAAAFGIAASMRLDLLALGELKATALGIRVRALEIALFFVAAAATVTAVVLGGAIGFIGLTAPHAVRLAGVARHRALLPLAVMLGGTVLTVADTAARTVWAPQQLPVGILTAVLGVPAMLLLLARAR